MENRTWEYSDKKTFRMGPIEVVKNASGNKIGIRECQELIDGRWEPFITHAPLVKRGSERAK